MKSPELEVKRITSFLKKTYQEQGFEQAVIAVSGGIDSALSLTLLTQALGSDKIKPLFLPYQDQSTQDAEEICQFNQIGQEKWLKFNIGPMVESFYENLVSKESAQAETRQTMIRLGNIMARCRMIITFDTAKKLSGLVCGTENKSERILGYFTRFGDGASDLEPIVHLYKTQVRQLAQYLEIPQPFLDKAPSAGLWSGQTDEGELGFSYEQADQVLMALEANQNLSGLDVDQAVVEKVVSQVNRNQFKHQVPYQLEAEVDV